MFNFLIDVWLAREQLIFWQLRYYILAVFLLSLLCFQIGTWLAVSY